MSLSQQKWSFSCPSVPTRLPRGMVEGVLIKVGEFIFPVDFVVLKTEGVLCTENEILIILGRPFLATSNALIN